MLNLFIGFTAFYFTLNLILLFIGFKYDTPKDVVENEGLKALVKAILTLLFLGVPFIVMQLIDDIK